MGGKDDSGAKIRVCGRIRPLAKYEIEKKSKEVVLFVNDGEKRDSELVQVTEPSGKIRWFELDAIFDKNSTQQEVYERMGTKAAVCNDIFQGFNCTVLAYGQTGAGKTFSMGTASHSKEIGEMDGTIPRCCHDLFKTIQEKCDGNAEVRLSYLEIYNEQLRDLLVDDKDAKKLTIREDLKGEVYVQGLESRVVQSPGDIGDLMAEASDRRVVAATAMNAVSSRSHAMCILKVTGVVEGPDGTDKFDAKLTLVDLAGSERAKKTGATGARLKEGVNINKSLLVLGQVVAALADQNKKRARKPPYRDSKLTRLLQDSLGGNSRTIMIACCSPADMNSEETINTLRYATSARNIKNTATRNVQQNISQEEAAKLKRENQLLKAEVKELTEQVRLLTEEYEYVSEEEEEEEEEGEEEEEEEAAEEYEYVTDDEAEEEEEKKVRISFPPKEEKKKPSFVKTSAEGEYNENDYIRDLEIQIVKLKEETQTLRKGLRKSSASAMAMPAMKVELAMLKEELEDKTSLEEENERLRELLQEAEQDAESARMAATRLAICNAELQMTNSGFKY